MEIYYDYFEPKKEEDNTEEISQPVRHYYGDAIRTIFLVAGAGIIITLPFFSEISKIPSIISIAMAVIFALFGGLMSPRQRQAMIANAVIALIGFIVFEYCAMDAYQTSTTDPKYQAFFLVNQILAVLFFLAMYLSMKTIRWRVLGERELPDQEKIFDAGEGE